MAYSYVHTTGDTITNGLDKRLLQPYVKKYLFSLINGLSRGKYGYGMPDTAEKIKQIYNHLGPDEELFVDSGGYSIIVGDVVPKSTYKMEINSFIDNVYVGFLERYAADYCHKILSLDIPIFLSAPQDNTTKNIYDYNIKATSRSKTVLDKNPILYDKYTWVWQFKIIKQFNIWRSVHDEIFGKQNQLKHYAVGGLVGVRGITNINFSPFIGPAYKILKLIKDKNLPETSLMHILGVYGKHDRFIMMFMDKLFNNYYLRNNQCSMDITFDTVNYTLSGLYKVRDMPLMQIPLIDPEEDKIENTKGITNSEYVNTLIKDEEVKKLVLDELKLIEEGKPIADPKLLSLTYVIYSYLLDYIMNKAIDEEDLVNKFLSCRLRCHGTDVQNHLSSVIDNMLLKYPFVFGNMKSQIMSNLNWLSTMHKNWEIGMERDEEWVDRAVIGFAKAINYPFDLNGEWDYK